MPDIIATPVPAVGYVLLTVNWSATPAVTFARVVRIAADGTETVVRPNTSSDASGDYMELSAGIAILYDTEAPFDVSLTYRTDALSGSVATATSTEVILQAGGTIWLRDPLYPANDRKITMGNNAPLPECIPGEGIFFRGMDDEDYISQTTNIAVNARSTPIPQVYVRGPFTSALNLICRTFADRDLMWELLSNGTVLLFDAPVKYGYDRRYMSIGDVPTSRPSRNFTRQWTLMSLPYVIVDRPPGMGFGVLGTRWIDLCIGNGGVYNTYADATAAGVTWQQLMYGSGATNGQPTGYRTWAMVLSDFASWAAVNSGGRTWEALLEGR
jgi:hypothetical protein